MEDRSSVGHGDRPVRLVATDVYFSLIRQQLEEHGQACVRVTGTSMRPLLRHMRDSVTIAAPGRIRAGDIVLFDRGNGRYALHRVIRTQKDTFAMAGDRQRHIETGLAYGQIAGVVVSIERGGRTISARSLPARAYGGAMVLRARLRLLARQILRPLKRPLHRLLQRGKGADR